MTTYNPLPADPNALSAVPPASVALILDAVRNLVADVTGLSAMSSLPKPSLTVRASVSLTTGVAVGLSTLVALTDTAAAPGTVYTFTARAAVGWFVMTTAGGVTVPGSGTKRIAMTGTLAQIVAGVAAGSYTPPGVGVGETVSFALGRLPAVFLTASCAVTSVAAVSTSLPVGTQLVGVAATGPAITGPVSITLPASSKFVIPGISYVDSTNTSTTITNQANLACTSGTLSGTAGTGGTLNANATNAPYYVAPLAALNTFLGTVAYTAGSSTGTDSITLKITDQNGNNVTMTIGVVITAAVVLPTMAALPYTNGGRGSGNQQAYRTADLHEMFGVNTFSMATYGIQYSNNYWGSAGNYTYPMVGLCCAFMLGSSGYAMWGREYTFAASIGNEETGILEPMQETFLAGMVASTSIKYSLCVAGNDAGGATAIIQHSAAAAVPYVYLAEGINEPNGYGSAETVATTIAVQQAMASAAAAAGIPTISTSIITGTPKPAGYATAWTDGVNIDSGSPATPNLNLLRASSQIAAMHYYPTYNPDLNDGTGVGQTGDFTTYGASLLYPGLPFMFTEVHATFSSGLQGAGNAALQADYLARWPLYQGYYHGLFHTSAFADYGGTCCGYMVWALLNDNYARTFTSASMSWANGVVTVVNTAAWPTDAKAPCTLNGASILITLTGHTPAAYNVTAVTGTVLSATSYSFPLAANPGAMTVAGQMALIDDAYACGMFVADNTLPKAMAYVMRNFLQLMPDPAANKHLFTTATKTWSVSGLPPQPDTTAAPYNAAPFPTISANSSPHMGGRVFYFQNSAGVDYWIVQNSQTVPGGAGVPVVLTLPGPYASVVDYDVTTNPAAGMTPVQSLKNVAAITISLNAGIHIIVATTPIVLISPAIFVSPSGSDSTGTGTAALPYLTVNKARTVMQGSVKTCYLRAGTYALAASVVFGSADSNTTYLAYPGETPILTGSNSTAIGLAVNTGGVSGVTINGLTIQNFTQTGIDFTCAYMTITNCTFSGITASSTNQGCIYGHFVANNASITHNKILNCTGPGIAFAAGSTSETINNSVIDNNIVLNTNTSAAMADSGAIYVLDRSHLTTAFSITNNVIGGYGASTSAGRGIYLDDETSHVTVTGNTVYGVGQYGLQIHGGNNCVFQDNIFDLSLASKLALYQDVSGQTDYGMAGNIFQNNIVYSTAAVGPSLWDQLNQGGGSQALPAVSHNLYYDTSGTLGNTGVIIDSAPVVGNPLFTSAATHNYTIGSGSPALAAPVSFVAGSTTPGPH